jgi:hypothetical protein
MQQTKIPITQQPLNPEKINSIVLESSELQKKIIDIGFMNGPNKPECSMTLGLKCLKRINTLAY